MSSLPLAIDGGPPAVDVAGLCRRYGRNWALVDVALRVPRGTAVLVAGRNGSGKSTLLKVLAGALRPDRGQVRIGGVSLADSAHEVRRRVALLGHHAFTYESLSAGENLDVFARFLGIPDRKQQVAALLEEVGLGRRALDPVSSFSAGMRKRLAIARLLLQKPEVALLDEPYGELDPPGIRFVDALIPRLQAAGTTVLLASHLLERGAALCPRGIVLERGRLTFDGPSRELLLRGGLGTDALEQAS